MPEHLSSTRKMKLTNDPIGCSSYVVCFIDWEYLEILVLPASSALSAAATTISAAIALSTVAAVIAAATV